MASVPASSTRYSTKSQTSRSTWLPSETQWRKPMPSVAARSKIETMSAPLWLTRPIGPSRSVSVSSTTEEQSAR